MYIQTLSKTVTVIALLLTVLNAELKPKENRATIILKDDDKAHLTIDYVLQKRFEVILDHAKEHLHAEEILVAAMHSSTGEVLAMTSSNRYKSGDATKDDGLSFNPKFSEYLYEPGSVLMPLTLAIALDYQYADPNTFFRTYNGKLKVGDGMITDHEAFPSLSATDIVVHSSNIGISQISWMLSGEELRDGLQSFGLGSPSGIDLSKDLPGQIKSVELLNDKLHRANTAYGYGIEATFLQLLKAYSAFNNDGIIVTPRIVDHFGEKEKDTHTVSHNTGNQRAVSHTSANQIQDILIEVVNHGTGLYATIHGLEIGGKTGTAQILENEKYIEAYNSSFYGFANDNKGNKYTIGVLVIRAKKKNTYFASQSAVPVFRKIVEEMVKREYLVPEEGE